MPRQRRITRIGESLVVEETGHIASPRRRQARRPLEMSRHRFLMLGASIVGVGMLPFAQRNYAYAEVGWVTPEMYAARGSLDTDDHTAVLHDMFSDGRLRAPYHFRLPPCPNGTGWMVVMGSSFGTFPVKSNWTLRGSRLAYGSVDPRSALHRRGEVVSGKTMFENTNTELGNNYFAFEGVYVEGRKYEWAQMNGGYLDIDQMATFLKISQNPEAQSDRWNHGLRFVGCVVRNWPGIACDFHQLENFEVSYNEVSGSHRGSLIFRYGARIGSVNHNRVTDGGDDCIAFNGNTDAYYQRYPNNLPPKAQSVNVIGNVLSEKQAQDIPEPLGGRKRSGNSPLAVRGGESIYLTDNEVLYTMDGYTDSDG